MAFFVHAVFNKWQQKPRLFVSVNLKIHFAAEDAGNALICSQTGDQFISVTRCHCCSFFRSKSPGLPVSIQELLYRYYCKISLEARWQQTSIFVSFMKDLKHRREKSFFPKAWSLVSSWLRSWKVPLQYQLLNLSLNKSEERYDLAFPYLYQLGEASWRQGERRTGQKSTIQASL